MSTFWKQALEAAGWTFMQVFVVTFAASFTDMGALQWDQLAPMAASAILAAAGAAISIIKSMVVRQMGETESPLFTGAGDCDS